MRTKTAATATPTNTTSMESGSFTPGLKIMVEMQAKLPRYLCYKRVHALKIADLKPRFPDDGTLMMTPVEKGFVPFILDAAFVAKHNPQVERYYVVYDDGYSHGLRRRHSRTDTEGFNHHG